MSQTKNPWKVVSLYDLQYFNCPECEFKNYSKQKFVNHAYEIHPESIENLNDIQDNSMKDIICPWMLKKEEVIDDDDIFDIDHSLDQQDDDIEFDDVKDSEQDDIKSNINHVLSETKPNPTVSLDQLEPNHCAHCDIYFVNLGKLQSHLKKFHDDENVSESDFLIPDFEMSEDLDNIDQNLTRKRKIINEEKEEDTVTCPKCDKSFSRKYELNRHMLSIHERIRPFQCDLCPTNYMSITNLRYHYEGKHNQKLTKNSSEFRKSLQNKLQNEKNDDEDCSSMFKGVFKFQKTTNQNEKVSKIEKPSTKYQTKRKCVECDWSGPSGYKKHWLETHPDVPLPFLCHICDYAAVLNYQLTDHIKNSHEKVKKEKDAKCDICNKLVSSYK